MTMSSTPWERSQSSMNAMNGRSTKGTTGLGTVDVSGRSRVPSPPARMSACIVPSLDSSVCRGGHPGSPDALVRQAGRARGLDVQEVASVHQKRPAHAGAHLAQVELGELR